jgi:Ca2+-dependent lipid-binding protein
LDAKASLAFSVKCSPDYPYIPFLNISLTEIPDFHVKIEAQSESGLNGIDFGSFPVVSKWIKAGISNALAEYLLPQYISIDILAWLRGEYKIVRYFGLQELPDEVG